LLVNSSLESEMIWFAPETWPFGAALALLVALLIIEGIGLLLSMSPAAWLDAAVPDSIDGADGPLGWLHVGKVPLMVLFGIFLVSFALCGYAIEAVASSIAGGLIPAWLATIPAALAGIASVSMLGGLIAKIMPSDESNAVSELSLIGRAGIVTQGLARNGVAAEAKVRDLHGRAHYVMVEPDVADEQFEEGAAVLLVKKVGVKYRAIKNPHPELL
jgi:Protein of unknown function (DUF1449)